MKVSLTALPSPAPSYGLVLAGTAAIVVYYGLSYRHDFIEHGEQSFTAIRSLEFYKFLLVCFGGSASLWYNAVVDCWGKYMIKEQVDAKFLPEVLLILAILLPSVCSIANWDDINATSFFWPLFHVQIMVIINVAILFWAEKMSLSVRSKEVIISSLLNCATFTTHIFTNKPSWTATSNDGGNVVYMFLYAVNVLFLFHCTRLTYNKKSKRNAVVLIDTAAAEQQWAMCIISAILAYYLTFFILEAGVYRGNGRFSLHSDYISAQYVLLSVTSLGILTLHQRKEMYNGVMSQASLEIKRLFVRYVSHEIRTPLNTTLLGLNLLETDIKEGVTDTAVLTELISDATSSCTIAIGILNDLLMYEKIDGGLLTLERAETPVWEFVEGVLKVFLIQAKSSNVELAWPQRCVKGVFAEIDHYKLSQVLRNLVSNALKFTPAGGRVRISAEVLVPGMKARTARSLCVLREMDETAAEEYEAAGGSVPGSVTQSPGKKTHSERAKRGRKQKPVAKSAEFDDFGSGIARSVSAASEETPPHTYAFPTGSPARRAVNYSARGVLHPEASSATVESATGAATTPTAAAMKAATAALDATTQSAGYSALSNAATSEDLELGGSSDAPMHADEGTAKTLTVGTPAHPPAPQHSTPAPNAPAHSSPDSSNESSPPEKTTQSFLSDKNFDFARRMFSMDQDRSNMQVFPSVTMVRISVTDSGAGISKENQERLFKEIVQFNAGKLQNGQGSGIGLWISNTIVKLHGGKIGVMSDGEGQGSSFYIDLPISKIERGSNYKHVSPAHLDVSSKHKYNSPDVSPARSRAGHSGASSPAVHNSPHPMAAGMHPPFSPNKDPNRSFISPESERGSLRATGLPAVSESSRPPPLHGPPLASITFPANVGSPGGVQTALLAPLRLPGGAYAGQLPALDAHGSVRYPLEMLPKGLSDQSIFTGGGSNRSSHSRSRRTNQSSFSTETDGLSAKTDSVDSLKCSPGLRGLSSHLEAALEACQEEGGEGPTYLPYRPTEVQTMLPNIAVNLFPEGSARNSQESNASRDAPEPRAQPAPALSAEAQRAKLLFDKRALIVDDSATNRKFVNRLLRTKIGTRDEAEDGQVAVRMVAQAIAENAPYDVILMDYVMPVMDGPTATEEIRRLGFKGVILGVTGNGHQPEIELFVKAGADKVLIKPLSADQFYGTLLDMLT